MARLRAAAIVLASLAVAADWPAFRGPRGDGRSPDSGLPTRWGPDENVQWKVKLPGPGSSSPTDRTGARHATDLEKTLDSLR